MFSGAKTYPFTIVKKMNDGNFFDLIEHNIVLYSNIKLEKEAFYAQTSLFAVYLHNYLNSNPQKHIIKSKNKYNSRYNSNDDVFVHVRLGDVIHTNPGILYYDNVLSTLNFTPLDI